MHDIVGRGDAVRTLAVPGAMLHAPVAGMRLWWLIYRLSAHLGSELRCGPPPCAAFSMMLLKKLYIRLAVRKSWADADNFTPCPTLASSIALVQAASGEEVDCFRLRSDLITVRTLLLYAVSRSRVSKSLRHPFPLLSTTFAASFRGLGVRTVQSVSDGGKEPLASVRRDS